MDRLWPLLAFGPTGWGDEIAAGALVTISLALATLPFGITLGLLVALAQRAENRLLSGAATVFNTVFRGLPELLTLLIVYYGGQLLLQWLLAAAGFSARVQVNAFAAGMVALGLVLAAFSAEVWAGALNSIAKGQREAGYALGLTRWQTFRLVVAPQLLRVALPGLSNNWLALLKETSLVSTIALPDLMRQTNVAVGNTKEPFFFFVIAILIYLGFSILSGGVIALLEARANRGMMRARA